MSAMELTDRWRYTIIGLSITVLLGALATLGVKFAFGAFDQGYDLRAAFASAGQGLGEDSDVKIRGVNVGQVEEISLTDQGRAEVRMRMSQGEDVPAGAVAVVRPKTLFGEKFIDLVIDEEVRTEILAFRPETPDDPCASPVQDGVLLGDGDRVDCTVSGFELERVLADAFPVISAIDPAELQTVLGTLATAADALGPAINNALAVTPQVTDQAVRQDANTRRFLDDFADVTETLDRIDGELLATAGSLNEVLPRLNARSDQLQTLLEQTARLSGDLATLFENNRGYVDAAFTDGMRTLDLLYRNRQTLPSLVEGLRKFIQLQVDVIRIPVNDGPTAGTLMAAVRGLSAPEAGDLSSLFPDAPSGLAPLSAPPSSPGAAGAGPAPDADRTPEVLPTDPETFVTVLQELLGL